MQKSTMRVLPVLVLCTLAFAIVFAKESPEYLEEYWVYREALKLFEECGDKIFSICLKEKSLRYLDNLPNTIDLGGGLRIKQTDGNRTSRQHASVKLPDEPKAREEALDKALLETFMDYMSTHSLEYKLPLKNNDLEKGEEEGRKKKGGGGGNRMKSLFMLFQLKAAVLGAIALKFIGLLAFKALLLAKIALTISGVVALKKLVEQKSHSSTYEVYAHPHYDEHSHYDRSFKQDLPYRGQTGGARSIT